MSELENSKQQIANKILESLCAKEPVLPDPDQLTNNIMGAIQEEHSGSTGRSRTISIAYRLLVAATVCFLMLFGVEEYVFFDKVKSLEGQASSISKDSFSMPGYRYVLSSDTGLYNVIKDAILKPGVDKIIKLPFKTKLKLARLNSIDIQGVQLQGLMRMRDIVQKRNQKFLNN